MSKTRSPLRIHLRQSRRLIQYLHLLHALVLFYTLAITLKYPAMLVAVLIVSASWLHFTLRSNRQSNSEQEVIWDSNGNWRIREGPGDYEQYVALSSCFNAYWLTILGFQRSRLKRRYSLILGDNCDPDQWRRLRTRLQQNINR
ncbi:MAG: hypothetical protein OQK92_05155 [Sedimenticola sp.]|uniref:Toxin CptA n=1 Tax=Sedimenticola thiotaurini TaxID=1543721 RepID=A0A558CT68_9GAMM|nr:hypothetical protein [Sedimenticola sp.]TVT51955.1 MAG: hypothetical protein FHK82_14515 [Sedimenticola thiotaurini]